MPFPGRPPGPTPTRAQIDGWIAAFVAFAVSGRASATLMIDLSVGPDTSTAVDRLSLRFRDALAARLSAFPRTGEPGPSQPLRHAWMKVVLRELGLACLEAARFPEKEPVLTVAADLFERFVTDTDRHDPG